MFNRETPTEHARGISRLPSILLIGLLGTLPLRLQADQFTFPNQDGKLQTEEGTLLGTAGRWQAVEKRDGEILIIPKGAVRNPGPAPSPLSGEEMARQLADEFGEELFRSHYEEPYLIGLVLTAPLEKQDEERVQRALGEAVEFMHSVERGFNSFVDRLKLEVSEPRHTLVMLIFESDSDFEEYATQKMGDGGLSAGILAGFYSGKTNRLYVRMSECLSYEIPLHEAIHQQVFNRGIFNRLSPVPAWFNEGIATAFEAERGRISTGPFRVHSQYVWQAQSAGQFDWAEVVENDRAFRGDIFAATAYTHAWCIHWLLVNEYTDQYAEYVKLLGTKPTLGRSSREERNQEFEQTFGKTIQELQYEFPQAIRTAVKRRGVRLPKRREPGYVEAEVQLAYIELYQNRKTLRKSREIEFTGKLKNISPVRDMSFYVALFRPNGEYTDWYVDNLASRRRVSLESQKMEKHLPEAPGGQQGAVYLFVRSAIPGSPEAERWAKGDLPTPGLKRGG